MTAPLPADALALLHAAGDKDLLWRVGAGYYLVGVEVAASTRHRINDPITDGLLYLPGMAGPGDVVHVYPTDRGLEALS